ncbi:FbpB family small basic protein [Bacillus sp. OV322]|nr:FbpB family small basic protein [Bacillus sp. OV322]
MKKGEIMKRRKRSFEDLVLENKMELLKDLKQMEKIEERLENRHMLKAE